MLTIHKILNHLKSLSLIDSKDPISLGFISNVQLDEKNLSLDLTVSPELLKFTPEWTTHITSHLKQLDQDLSIQIHSKNTPQEKPKNPENGIGKVQKIIAVSSCKGGVGKSTVAAHIALELARQGKRVGLCDLDIYGPSLPSIFGLTQQKVKTTDKNLLIPVEKDGLKLMSFGFLLGDAPAIFRGPIVTRYIQQILLFTEWGELDYLILDMPPGTGDVHITITQTVRLSGTIIVTTPHSLSLIDVARGILMFEKVSVPALGIVENMSYFQAPKSTEKHYIFGKQTSQSLSEKFGIKILAEIPLIPQFTESIKNETTNEHIKEATNQLLESLNTEKHSLKDIPLIYSDEKKITLTWKDGTIDIVSNFDLRLNSPDALSVNELTGERMIKSEDIRSDIKPLKITPIGNYAIGIEWNDGHTAGIYPYTLIKKLISEK